ncbi:MAG TPA: metallophosphoesterase, partial [Thermoanaerobaculia bacterium]|nr:metallophosphoesterase [Thermoanaerobaculia bacterium]
LVLILAPIGLILGVWAFAAEPAYLRVREVPLEIPGWHAARTGMRIAVLADLHTGSPYNGMDKLREVVRRTNAARPDLVLIAGDLVIDDVVGGRWVSPETLVPELGRLRAPLGVYAVLGNHDWWLDAPRVQRALERAGIPVLEDRAVRIDRGGPPFWLAGISDFWEGPHDVGKALAGVTDAAPVIAFTHNPDIFPKVPARVSLTLAGHTHGGQVWLPLIGRPIVPSIYKQRYAIGHVVEGGRHLFVAPGVGTSIIPVRFLVPPEISIVQLSSAARAR